MTLRHVNKCAAGIELPVSGVCPACGAGPGNECVKSRLREAQELERLREFASWVGTWVDKPVGSHSMMDLNVLFGEARDKIGALQSHKEQQRHE